MNMAWVDRLRKRGRAADSQNEDEGRTQGKDSSVLDLEIAPAEPPRTPAQLFEEILNRLGCTYDMMPDEDEDFQIYLFMYQGGAFHVRVPKSGLGMLKIEFPSFVDAKPDELAELRTCCNEFNIVSKLAKFVYTFDERVNHYHAHIVTPFMLNDGMPKPAYFVKALLESHFELRRDFVEAFGEAKRKRNKADETDVGYSRRVAWLLREQEFSHQTESFQIRRTQEASLCLGEMLDLCFGLHELDVAYMKIVDDESVKFEFDQDTIRKFDLKQNPTDISYYVYYNDANGDGSALRMVQVSLRLEYDDDVASYLRLSAILFPSVYGVNSTFVSGRNGLDALTFLIAVDKKDESQYKREYEYLWSEALDKRAHCQEDQLSDEQQFLLNADEPNMGFYLFRGRRLYAEGRYYEAVDFLTHAFFYLNDEYDTLSNDQLKAFRELAFLIGFSYMELQLFAEAYYFLDIVHDLNNVRYTQEYVNCLVNSNDFRAGSTIENLMSFVRGFMMQSEDEDEDVPEHISEFYNFLRRRQVFLWVNQDHLQAAETECNAMLNEPDNADFALDELAYIQKLRRSGVVDVPVDDLPF